MRLIPAHAGKTSSLGSAAFRPRAHPRSRGENPLSSADLAWPSGSSPLTRGKRGAALRVPRHRGLIPAHAGKTGSRPRRPARSTAHPRSRGENRRGPPGKARTLGSSPLTRGKLSETVREIIVTGLIPAHAGKTYWAKPVQRPCWAHPRSRGENGKVAPPGTPRSGSSPLTRGKRTQLRDVPIPGRLIPAHAGKTSLISPWPPPWPAHPRSRGENPISEATASTIDGSSPLTRGKPDRYVINARMHGLIPAHAGKTAPRSPRSRPAPAHPRSRGENIRVMSSTRGAWGSSPLTRGKHRLGQSVDRVPGLIPAHAGKTWKPTRRRQSDSAHPRSRGENVETKDRGRLGDGSSPLTRGKHFLRGNRNGGERLIPAHAGKTRRPTPYRTAPEAHPRSRGENVEPLDRVAVHEGSSPLTRGKRGPLPRPLGRVRLIPAHAGKTPGS